MNEHPVPYEAPEGFEWHISESDSLDWSLTAWQIGQRRCRFSDAGVRCSNIADAVLYRHSWSGRAMPWAYCAEHLFGRWIENGKVLGWRLQRKDRLTGAAALLTPVR